MHLDNNNHFNFYNSQPGVENSNDVNLLRVSAYLMLVMSLQTYHKVSAKNLSREIGQIAADLIEPEFAKMDRRNLIERKKYLESELNKVKNLEMLDELEEDFISHGKEYADKNGLEPQSLYDMGIPICTLEAAKIF